MSDSDHETGQAVRPPQAVCPAGRQGQGRSCGRLGVEIEARLRLRGQSNLSLSGRVTDVCLGGLCVALNEAPPETGAVLVELCLTTPGECHVLPGRLSWARPEGAGWRAGIELPDETAWAWFVALSRMVPAAGVR